MSSPRPPLLIADSVRIYGGAERFVLDAAAGLSARGWPVTVVAYPGAPLDRRARAAGLDVHNARTRANGAPWTVLPLMHFVRRRNIGAVLSVYDKDLRTLAWAARMSGGNVAVVHTRECDEAIKDRPWIRFFHTRVADRIVVNSDATRQTTSSSAPWLAPSRITVIGKGIDLSAFARIRDRRPAPTSDTGSGAVLTLGFLGQLVGRKRVDVLLRALDLTRSPVCLRVAGTGAEEDRLRSLARELGLSERVEFVGFARDVPGFLASVDALVLPSLVEGWGYVLAEAAAAARAILAFERSSVPEVVGGEEHGALLLADTDPIALAAGIDRLAAEGVEGWRRRGESLARWADGRLGVDRMIDELDATLLAEVARRRVA